MFTTRFSVSALVAAGLLAAGVAAAGALSASGALAAGSSSSPAASSSPSPSGSGQAVPGPRHFDGRGGSGRFGGPFGLGAGPMLHGEFVVSKPGGGTETELIQSGKISAKSGNTITVKSSDGYTLGWTLNGSTVIRTGWTQGSVKDLAVGDTVLVTGAKSGSGGVARMVGERPAGAAAGVPGPGWRGRTPATPAPSTSGAGTSSA